MCIVSWKIKAAHQKSLEKTAQQTLKSDSSNWPQDKTESLTKQEVTVSSKMQIPKQLCLYGRKSCMPQFLKCLRYWFFLPVLISHTITIILVGDQLNSYWKTICNKLQQVIYLKLLIQKQQPGKYAAHFLFTNLNYESLKRPYLNNPFYVSFSGLSTEPYM